MMKSRLAEVTTEELRAALSGSGASVALLPVGSVEPHGPHLPLATDTWISDAASLRAAAVLTKRGSVTFVAPAVAYGVTRFAEGFSGAITVPPEVLSKMLRAITEGLLSTGFSHVCLVNNHLEPEHDAAVRASIEGLPKARASVACPLSRRWARTLSAEFKSGACHAGRYETSLVLAAAPGSVDMDAASGLPALTTSLSEGIRAGQTRFLDMGLDKAYTGAPAEASLEEGNDLLDRLATMVVTEVEESLLLREI